MEILGYGEDALTLWAVQNKLDLILQTLQDSSSVEDCKVFFRPSFGRSGGESSSQFGEFDFIIVSPTCLYLGESKWDRSPEIKNGNLTLRNEQILRHYIFEFYVTEWLKKHYKDWDSFQNSIKCIPIGNDSTKPVAPSGSLLASNLEQILNIIKDYYDGKHSNPPCLKNVLLYLCRNTSSNNSMVTGVSQENKSIVLECPQGIQNSIFILVPIDYSSGLIGNYIKINL